MKWEKIGNIAGQRGNDGKDADPVDFDAVARRAAEFVPAPKDGRDADAEAVSREVLERVTKALPVPKDGRDGADGKSVDPTEVAALVREQVAALPKPRDGVDGLNGKDADPDVVAGLVASAVDAVLPALVVKALETATAGMVERVLTLMPSPEPGRNGQDADPQVMRMQIVEELAKLPPPLPGKDADPDTIRYEISKQLSSIPKGNDGRDGLGIDDLSVEQKDARTIALVFRNGDRERRHEITFPVVLDEGVYKKGQIYQKGAGVTYGGSWWIAQKDTDAAPGGDSGDWRLAVKRGRDGKDGGS